MQMPNKTNSDKESRPWLAIRKLLYRHDTPLAPMNMTVSQPEMCFASCFSPDGGTQCGRFVILRFQRPVRLDLLKEHQFQFVAATAWAPHCHRPIVSVITTEVNMPRPNRSRWSVAINNDQFPSRAISLPKRTNPKPHRHAASLTLMGARLGNPRSGSTRPNARSPVASVLNSSSGISSSSPAACEKSVRAHPELPSRR